MKKVTALILLILTCFVFSSCEKGKSISSEFTLLPFNSTVSVSGGEEENFEMDISFSRSDDITIMVKKPENIAGITYTKSGEKIVYTKDGITAEAQFLKGAESKNPIAVIFSVLEEMGKQKYICPSQDKQTEGNCLLGSFSFVLSENRELKSISSCGFTFEFLQK